MPTYLIHGFRWPRPLIRIHIILQNLDDAAAEWLVAPETTRTMLDNFHDLYPDSMASLNQLRFVEQYDPSDLSAAAASQPYAYVADVCEEVRLSVPINEVTQKGVSHEQWIAMMDLKDKLAPEEKVGWYIVVCGDEERWAPPENGHSDSSSQVAAAPPPSQGSYTEVRVRKLERQNNLLTSLQNKPQMPPMPPAPPEQPEPKGLKKLFGSARIGRRKSKPALAEMNRTKSHESRPQTSSSQKTQTSTSQRPPTSSSQRPPMPDTAA